MRAFLATGMHLKTAALLGALALGLTAPVVPAAAADIAISPRATPLPRFAQSPEVVEGYSIPESDYRPACPYRYYYACRSDLYGVAQCTCWPGVGFVVFGIY